MRHIPSNSQGRTRSLSNWQGWLHLRGDHIKFFSRRIFSVPVSHTVFRKRTISVFQ